MKFKDYINEEYLMRAKSSIPGKGSIEVFENPTSRDKKDLGDIIRFTAYNKNKTVYTWKYDQAHHVDISRAVGIKHRFNDPDLLMGGAEWKNGIWVFNSSDFLLNFKRMLNNEKDFITALLNNDWSWVNKYIDVDTTLNKLRKYI
jgi:hypothetical protein